VNSPGFSFLLLTLPQNGTLYQTDVFENYNISNPITSAPVYVDDVLGRMMFISPSTPVENPDGSPFDLYVNFEFVVKMLFEFNIYFCVYILHY